MLPPFVAVANVTDPTLRRVQEAVARVLRRVCSVPLLDGLLVGPLTFAVGVPQVLTHKLSRVPVGYLVASVNAPAVIFQVGTADAARITLQASAACSATLWVF